MGHDSWHVSVRRRTITLFVALVTLLAGGIIAATATTTASASTISTRDSYSSTVGNSTFEAARNKYGLAKEMCDGATLHAFEWSFKTIEENIPDIAAAGYTSVQTEPIQKIKDNCKLAPATGISTGTTSTSRSICQSATTWWAPRMISKNCAMSHASTACASSWKWWRTISPPTSM